MYQKSSLTCKTLESLEEISLDAGVRSSISSSIHETDINSFNLFMYIDKNQSGKFTVTDALVDVW